jgi:hypothetical protein
LVTDVTSPVKPATLRTMLEAVDWTPVTIDAAKAAPGSVGNWTPRPDVPRDRDGDFVAPTVAG